MGLVCATAILLSYVEAMIPPIFSAVPGVKVGLPNIAVIYMLYTCGIREATAVSVVRIAVVSMLFGNAMIFLYSVAGAILSLTVMGILKRLDFLSATAVSIAGAVSHNIGQIIVAILVLKTVEIAYYIAVLAVTGTVAGLFVGLTAVLMLKRLPKKLFFK